MKAGRYGRSPFKTPAVPAKKPVAPTPTPSAAKITGPMQQTEASNAALNPPIESIVTELFDGVASEVDSRYGHMAITFLIRLQGDFPQPECVRDNRLLLPHVLGAYIMTIMPPKQRMAPIAS